MENEAEVVSPAAEARDAILGTPLATAIGEKAVVEAGLAQEQQRGLTAGIKQGKYKFNDLKWK